MFQLHKRKYDIEEINYNRSFNKTHCKDLLFSDHVSNKMTQNEDPLTRLRSSELATVRKVKQYTPSEGTNEKEIIQILNFGISQSTTFANFISKIVKAKQELIPCVSSNNITKIINILAPLIDSLCGNLKPAVYASLHDYITSLLSTFSKELQNKLYLLHANEQLNLLSNYEEAIDSVTKNHLSNLYLHSVILILIKPFLSPNDLKTKQTNIINEIGFIPINFGVEQYVWFMTKQGFIWSTLLQTLINIENKNGVGDPTVTHCLFRVVGEMGIPLAEYISLSSDSQTLSGIIKGMTANEVSHEAIILFNAINKTTNTVELKLKAICTLGRALGKAIKLDNAEDINIEMWKLASNINTSEEMIKFSIDLIGCTALHCSIKTLDRVLRSIGNKLDKFGTKQADKLDKIILNAIAPLTGRQLCSILSCDGMSKMFEFLSIEQQESIASPLFIKVELLRYERKVPLNDIRTIQILLRLGQHLDSKTRIERMSSSPETERAIMYFIECVDFGKNLDRQMTFYSDCRQSFFHSTTIKTLLIHLTLRLTVYSQILPSKDTRKSFVRGSLAFVYCTIFELSSPFEIGKLAVLGCSVSLKVESFAQADTFMKIALSIVQERKEELELDQLRTLLKEIWGLSLAYPDNTPLEVPIQLMKIQIGKGIEDIEYLCGVLQMIVSFSMPSFLYHIENVESDDTLFSGDTTYIEENGNLLINIISMIKERILNEELVGNDKIRGIGLFVDTLLTVTEPNEKLLRFCDKLITSIQPINSQLQYAKYLTKISNKLQQTIEQLENSSNEE
ncbi:hypothetical protein conserved [Entamoeba histolytica]|nr:hypothetical protein conserved [Entamoeba histolytica]